MAITNQPPLETTLISSNVPTLPELSPNLLYIRKCLDDAAYQSILASERVFLARNNKEWLDVTIIN